MTSDSIKMIQVQNSMFMTKKKNIRMDWINQDNVKAEIIRLVKLID